MRSIEKRVPDTRRFTLVELLVAMGVFSLLLVLSMQLFSGMQRLWVRSEQKNEVFATARTAMEFVAARLQTVAYSEEMPFMMYDRATENGQSYCRKIFFPTFMPMNRVDSSNKAIDHFGLRFLSFEHDENNGTLMMKILSAKDAENPANRRTFRKYLPPYDTVAEAASKREAVKTAIEAISAADVHDCIEVIENVIKFKLIPYNIAGSGKNTNIAIDNGNIYEPPYVVEIEFTVFDTRENFRRWKDGSSSVKEDMEREYSYTFRRAVILSDRRKFE